VGVAELLGQALRPVKHKIDRAFIYGSFASGDYGNESDVDLFIVSKLSGLKLAELLGDVQNEIGRSINVSQFTSDEYNQRKENNDHFLTRVLEGPKITIIGDIDES
jgi:predicted nucleotidyltransferase